MGSWGLVFETPSSDIDGPGSRRRDPSHPTRSDQVGYERHVPLWPLRPAMRWPRTRWTVRRMMALIGAISVLLAGLRGPELLSIVLYAALGGILSTGCRRGRG